MREAWIDRLAGLALFLPVPLVLALFTLAPLGLVTSLALGTALMLSHRFYARPFALGRASRRCLYCGGAAAGPALVVDEPLGTTTWRACGEAHLTASRRGLAWAQRHAAYLRVGILGTLAAFLPGALLAGTGRLGPLELADAVALFRLGIAVTVLPLGWLSLAASAAVPERPRPPFPVHIQALIGTAAVLWLFRIVGLVWLVLAGLHLATRLRGV